LDKREVNGKNISLFGGCEETDVLHSNGAEHFFAGA
jgi:hypothetical protein